MSASVERDLRNERIHVVDERNKAIIKANSGQSHFNACGHRPDPSYGQPS